MPAFTVLRSTKIEASPEQVFELISDFSTWPKWSPWLLSDKDATVTINGDPKAVGGGYSWDGPVVGAGQMEHVKLNPPEFANSIGTMDSQLRFTRPWKSESKVQLRVSKTRGDDGQEMTEVQWEMQGSLPLFLFFMKSTMVGMLSMDFDRGLRMMKELLETGEIISKTDVVGVTRVQPIRMVGLGGKTTLQEIGPHMEATIDSVKEALEKAGVCADGKWLSLYEDMNLKTQAVTYVIGMELPQGVAVPAGLIERQLPEFDAMHISHLGRYEHLGNAWSAAYQNAMAHKRIVIRKQPGVEVYNNHPDQTAVEDLSTDVFVPVK